VLIPLTIAGQGTARADPNAVEAGSAIQQFGACLSASKAGDLLLLIDQSGSLAETDPQGVRATAASYLLGQLATTTTAAGTALDVAVSGFDVGYQNLVGWTRLSEQTLPDLRRSVNGFRSLHNGLDTDYVAALEGVQREFRDRAHGPGTGCQALLWFTDGKFDLSPRDSSALRNKYGIGKAYAPGVEILNQAGVSKAIAAGTTALCRVGGIADQIHATGVLTIAVGLGQRNGGDFSFLRSVATGTNEAGTPCGQPSVTIVGEVRIAGDIDDLFFAFDAIGDPRQVPTLSETGICPREACAAQRQAFVLDPSIRSVHLLASAAPGVQFAVQPPGGAQIVFGNPAPPPGTLGGGRFMAQWLSERTLDLSIERTDAVGWTGEWTVVFVDPVGTAGDTRAHTQIRITGDLVPSVVDADRLTLHTNDTVPLRLELRSEVTKQPVATTDLPGVVTLGAELRVSAARTVPITEPVDKTDLGRPITLKLTNVPPGNATIRLTLTVRTADLATVRGTQLADRIVDVPVMILPPLNFPHVTGRVDFPHGEGAGPFTAALTATGPGCVWVEGSTVTAAPDGVGTATVGATKATGAGSCLSVARGATARLQILLRLQRPGTGTVAGTVAVHLAPSGEPEHAITVAVPFLANVVKPAATRMRVAVLAAALVLGLGAPVLFLYLAKLWTARIPGTPLLAGTVRATLVGGAVRRDGRPFAVDHDDVEYVPVSSHGTRGLTLPGGVTLAAKAGWKVTDPGWTGVEATGRTVLTTGLQRAPDGSGIGRLPLAVHNTWAALVGDLSCDDFEVLVLASGSAAAATYQQLSEEIRTRLPYVIEQARACSDTQGRAADGVPQTPEKDWLTGFPASAPGDHPTGIESTSHWWGSRR
jgi:hypothetical protein